MNEAMPAIKVCLLSPLALGIFVPSSKSQKPPPKETSCQSYTTLFCFVFFIVFNMSQNTSDGVPPIHPHQAQEVRDLLGSEDTEWKKAKFSTPQDLI